MLSGQVVIALGDSLTAGYRLPLHLAWPARLGQMLEHSGLKPRVINAGISGDTSAGGLSRVAQLLRQHNPALLVLCIGANDALRGSSLAAMKRNLAGIIEVAEEAGVTTLLVGMRLPPNYGPKFTRDFHDAYVQLAQEYEVPFIPFLLEGMATDTTYFLDDGIHPNARGHELVARHLCPVVKGLLDGLASTAHHDSRIRPLMPASVADCAIPSAAE